MFNATAIFKERLKAHFKRLNRYLRYIFNGHFMIALMFMIVTLAVYYQRWLMTVSPSFPAATVISLALTLVVIYNPIQSFLKEPDKVFLTVKETAMGRYFTLALIYNYVMQLYLVVFVIAAISPLYFTFYERPVLMNLIILFVLLLIKAWHLLIQWRTLQIDNPKLVYGEFILRLILTFVLFYSFITLEYFLYAGVLYIIYLNCSYLLLKKRNHLNWDRLIENDANRLAKFYRFVSLFAQVPQVKTNVRKRRLLTTIVNRYTPFEKEASYAYLFRLTFFRSSEYFSLFIRLTILGILAIIFVENNILRLALAILFMYMTSFQLQTLFYHYRMNVWLDLYPLPREEKQASFLRLAKQIAQVQALLFTISFLFLTDITFAIAMLFIGTIFNLAFHEMYIKKKIGATDI